MKTPTKPAPVFPAPADLKARLRQVEARLADLRSDDGPLTAADRRAGEAARSVYAQSQQRPQVAADVETLEGMALRGERDTPADMLARYWHVVTGTYAPNMHAALTAELQTLDGRLADTEAARLAAHEEREALRAERVALMAERSALLAQIKAHRPAVLVALAKAARESDARTNARAAQAARTEAAQAARVLETSPAWEVGGRRFPVTVLPGVYERPRTLPSGVLDWGGLRLVIDRVEKMGPPGVVSVRALVRGTDGRRMLTAPVETAAQLYHALKPYL